MFYEARSAVSSPRAVAFGDDARRLLTQVLIAASVTGAGGLVLVAAHLSGVPTFELLRDPASHFGIPAYAGLISYAGVTVLTLCGGILGFATAVGPLRFRRRFALAAAFSLLVAMDDQYVLHEQVLPALTGLPEVAVYGVYALLALAILASIGKSLLHLRHAGLWLAFGAFGLMVAIDLFVPLNAVTLPLEDLAKFGGYVMWSCYWVAAAARALAEGFAHGA